MYYVEKRPNKQSFKVYLTICFSALCKKGSKRMIPASIYQLKVNNRNRTRCEICSKLTIKIPATAFFF